MTEMRLTPCVLRVDLFDDEFFIGSYSNANRYEYNEIELMDANVLRGWFVDEYTRAVRQTRCGNEVAAPYVVCVQLSVDCRNDVEVMKMLVNVVDNVFNGTVDVSLMLKHVSGVMFDRLMLVKNVTCMCMDVDLCYRNSGDRLKIKAMMRLKKLILCGVKHTDDINWVMYLMCVCHVLVDFECVFERCENAQMMHACCDMLIRLSTVIVNGSSFGNLKMIKSNVKMDAEKSIEFLRSTVMSTNLVSVVGIEFCFDDDNKYEMSEIIKTHRSMRRLGECCLQLDSNVCANGGGCVVCLSFGIQESRVIDEYLLREM